MLHISPSVIGVETGICDGVRLQLVWKGQENAIEFWYRKSTGRRSDGFWRDHLQRCEVGAAVPRLNPVAAFCITALSTSRILLQGA